MKNNQLLYIGLNGFAGSGKDTVARALRLMLSYEWTTFEEFNSAWKRELSSFNYATFGITNNEDSRCHCIAFADQLKYICAAMFGIPVDRFYYNKETAWIRICPDFRYTEQKPYMNIVTAEEYHEYINRGVMNPELDEKWMSLRELLVYVGTYVCQEVINKNCFINGVENTIRQLMSQNKNLKYVICTDVRFYHELDYIRNHNGININIRRDDVKQLGNVAEHDLDDCEDFDFVIENNGTYDELMLTLWNLIHDNEIFNNEIIELPSRDCSNNYLRKSGEKSYVTCFEYDMARVSRSEGHVVMIDPSGGPQLIVGDKIPGTDLMICEIKHSDLGGWEVFID